MTGSNKPSGPQMIDMHIDLDAMPKEELKLISDMGASRVGAGLSGNKTELHRVFESLEYNVGFFYAASSFLESRIVPAFVTDPHIIRLICGQITVMKRHYPERFKDVMVMGVPR